MHALKAVQRCSQEQKQLETLEHPFSLPQEGLKIDYDDATYEESLSVAAKMKAGLISAFQIRYHHKINIFSQQRLLKGRPDSVCGGVPKGCRVVLGS